MAVLGKAQGDIESGQLYPNMVEDVRHRWAFIRKVYVIIAMQMILTAAVSAVVVFVRPIPEYLVSTRAGLGIYIVILISPLISMN